MDASINAPRCGVCGDEPAIWQDLERETAFCRNCGPYRAGIENGRALVALDMLSDAIAELRGAGLSVAQVAQLAGDELGAGSSGRDLRPKAASRKDPRPWMALLNRIEGSS